MNARDNYGNSLFILVCQQGNKRIAKFLMRRRADMNLQVRVYKCVLAHEKVLTMLMLWPHFNRT